MSEGRTPVLIILGVAASMLGVWAGDRNSATSSQIAEARPPGWEGCRCPADPCAGNGNGSGRAARVPADHPRYCNPLHWISAEGH